MRRRDALPDPEVVRGLHELDAALAGEPTADPDLALLVADVEAARPEPSAAFLASLDARVHAGFAKERATPRRPPWHVRLRQPQALAWGMGATLACGLAALVVAGGGGSGSDDASSGGSASVVQSSGRASGGGSAGDTASAPSAAAESSASTAKDAPQSAAGASAPSTAGPTTLAAPAPRDAAGPRKVERAAELTLTPKPDDVQDTADGVVRETQAAGGYVQQSSIQVRDDGGEASFTLRIPSARLDATLARLSKLAHVGALNQTASDITAQTASAADELADARAERRALLRALGRASTDRQIASLRARLRDNRSLIARRQGALDAQRRRADLATVSVAVEGTGTAKEDEGGGAWTPRDALHDAGRVLEVAGGVALIALAVLAPLALLALLAWLVARNLRGHRRETALDRSA